MEKNWFIFKGDHHLGPFSSEDLVRMLGHEKAKADDLIWREGEADWLPLKSHPALLAFFEPPVKETKREPPAQEEFVLKEPVLEEFVDDFVDEGPPPLPPLPVIEEPEPESGPVLEEDFWAEDGTEEVEDIEEEVLPPPLPPLPVVEEEVIEEPVVEMPIERETEPELEPEVEPESEPEKLIFDDFALDEEAFDEEEEDDETRDNIVMSEGIWEEAPPWQKGAMVSSLIIGLLMSLYFFNWEGSDVTATRFSGIAGAKKRDLLKVVNTSPKLGVKAKLALSNTGNEIWLATNKTQEAIIYLSLRSVKDRILSKAKEAIELRSVGELLKGGAKFRNIELVKGERIAEGEYEAYLVGYATGWKSRLAMHLRNYDFTKNLKFVKSFEPDFKLSVPFLYSIKPLTEFEKLLDKNKEKKKLDLAKPYQELMERHKTFSGLLSNIQAMYKDSLDKMNRGRDVRLFERRYAMEVEPILRDLLLDSNRRHISLMNEDKKRSEDYLKLVEEGKEIGILVSDIVTRTRKYGKMTNKKRKKLAGIFAPRIEEILKNSGEDVTRLQSELKRTLTD